MSLPGYKAECACTVLVSFAAIDFILQCNVLRRRGKNCNKDLLDDENISHVVGFFSLHCPFIQQGQRSCNQSSLLHVPLENSAFLVVLLLPDLCACFCPSYFFSLVDNPDCSVFWVSNLGSSGAGLLSEEAETSSHTSTPPDTCFCVWNQGVGKQGEFQGGSVSLY